MKLWSRLNARFRQWILARHPREKETTLTQKRIYILPTGAGVAFLVVSLLVLLLAINYENNLAYAVCFTMLSLFMTAIVHTYANLSGLQVEVLSVSPVFKGDQALFRFRLYSPRVLTQVSFGFDQQKAQAWDIPAGSNLVIEVPLLAEHRGWQEIALLRVSSLYPLGFFKTWSWLAFDQSVLVYPSPVKEDGELQAAGGSVTEPQALSKGQEDFQELKAYGFGMPINRIAWKVFAKGQGLHVKSYTGETGEDVWLSLNIWPNLGLEARLSRISYWVLELSRKGIPFGLNLNDEILMGPDIGENHKLDVLKALALYRSEPQTHD